MAKTELPLTDAGGMDLAQGANWYANRVIERMTHQPRPGEVRLEIRDILQEAYIAGARRTQRSQQGAILGHLAELTQDPGVFDLMEHPQDDSDPDAHLCGGCNHWYSGVACPDCVPDEMQQADRHG